MRTVGLAVLAALAGTAYAAGSATALPELGRCRVSATHEGKYTDKNCTVKAKKVAEKFTGEFEWQKETAFEAEHKKISGNIFEKAGPIGLTSNLVKCVPSEEHLLAKCREGETEERTPINIECSEIRDAGGEYSSKSPKEISRWHMTIDGCQALGMQCNNTGSDQEQLILNEMKGVVGYIKKPAPKEVGIAWSAESGKDIADFTCGEAIRVVVGGGTEKESPFYTPKGGGGTFIAPVTPINEMTSTVTQSAAVNTETAENIPGKFEGKGVQALEDYFFNPNNAIGNGTKWSPAGLTLTEALRLCGNCNNVGSPGGDEAAEIKA
jgi:hypothetical protein